jgi:hypothetical protein
MQRRRKAKENERERSVLKKSLTEPTLLEMSGFGAYQDLSVILKM